MKTLFSLIALNLLAAASIQAADAPYQFIKEIPIGGKAQWDYLKIDPEGQRLFVTHGTSVEVIDLQKGAVVGQIEDTPGVHGVAFAPKLGRVYTSNGRENKASIVDAKTLKTISKVDTGAMPDSILFEPVQSEVYTFNGRGASATVFNAETGKVAATIDLGGKPETPAEDPALGRIFVNIEDKSEVAVIDIKTRAVATRWPIAPGQSASGMAIDLENHRLFLGCDNKKMVMLDYITGKVIATVPIEAGVDANAFDPAAKSAFSSNGDGGTVTIAKEEAPDKLTVVQTLQTARGARTMTLDPATHNIYLPAPAPAFRVLVYGPAK